MIHMYHRPSNTTTNAILAASNFEVNMRAGVCKGGGEGGERESGGSGERKEEV